MGAPLMEMHGITGGDDDYLVEEVTDSVVSAIKRVLGKKDASLKEVRKAVRDRVMSLLWERTKQRPMVVVNLLEVR